MRYAQIRSTDISNGLGIGVSLFVQGCPIQCPGCHNESIWSFDEGREYTVKTEDKIIKLLKPDYITRFSILGGEPLLPQNFTDLYNLVSRIKKEEPNVIIWLWTGYKINDIIEQYKYTPKEKMLSMLLYYIDYIIDGPFIQEQKDFSLKFRGSINQIIWQKMKNIQIEDIHNRNYFILQLNDQTHFGFKEVAEDEVQ